jgi:hypothetical protein
MQDALCCFHTFKHDFLLRRPRKQAKAKANALRMYLLKKHKVDKETNPETWTPSMMWPKINAWRDYLSHEIDVCKEIDADLNFWMIHLISHWVEQIR